MGAFITPIRFPISDGLIVAALHAGLTATYGATGLTVQPKLPSTKTRRMVTVRNDSGPQDGSSSRRRYGINVWADSSVDAENIALECMSILRTLPAGVITATDSFSGPYEIPEDEPFVVNTKNLTHYYFTLRVSVKGNAPTP